MLRMILGLETPDAGVIEFEGRDITRMPAEQRGFGMVFQNYALFTNLNVFENVAFGIRPRCKDETEVGERVEELLALVHLPGYGERRISELSAGQQQRVAIARAIAMEPPLLLFDEPLANLDIGLRRETGWELRELMMRASKSTLKLKVERLRVELVIHFQGAANNEASPTPVPLDQRLFIRLVQIAGSHFSLKYTTFGASLRAAAMSG
jgi:ABC-type Fe3+/spermidine/putrescine transport system ATPase subunit